MDTCVVCGSSEFYTESGFYFCQQCETQLEGRRDQVVEYTADASTYVTKKKIARARPTVDAAQETSLGWTTWEAFNLILHGWTNELIMLGASADFKITVLQLWATYLGKLEAAFRSFTSDSLPRLPMTYRKKDSEILYGNKMSRERKRKRRSSVVTSDGGSTHASDLSIGRLLSQQKKKLVDAEYQKYLDSSASDTDGTSLANQSIHSIKADALVSKQKEAPRIYLNSLARAKRNSIAMSVKKQPIHRRTTWHNNQLVQHRTSVEHLTLPDLLAVLILALRINDEKIHVSDIIRFQIEGHMSSRKLDHFFPDDEPIPKDFKHLFHGYPYELLRKTASNLAQLVEVEYIPEPNIMNLIRQYCTDLQLPDGIALYAERMIALSPPKLTFEKWNTELPRYEAIAISIIMIILKILFGLDGVTEYEISRVVSKINGIAEKNDALDSKLFNFIEWQRYIECRKSVIMSRHSATKFRLDAESSTGNINEYLSYLKKFVTPGESVVRWPSVQQLTEVLDQNMENLAGNLPDVEPVNDFEASLTPMHSYLEQLLRDSDVDLPSILKQKFTSTKIGYMTNIETLKELAKECHVDLRIIDSSAQFLERIIPTTGARNLSFNMKKESKPTSIVISSKQIKSDDPLEYLHFVKTGKIVIDKKKHALYRRHRNSHGSKKISEENDFDDFIFEQVRSNGKLDIVDVENSDSYVEEKQPEVFDDEKLLLSSFERRSLRHGSNSHWHREVENRSSKNTTDCYSEGCDCIMCGEYSKPAADIEILGDGQSLLGDHTEDEVTILNDGDDDLTIFNDVPNTSNPDDPEISVVNERSRSQRESRTIFRPYKDYWLHRIATQRYSPEPHMRWHLLERDLPLNFQWLLHECARMIEIEAPILYHEFAVVEAYYADCLVDDYDQERAGKFYDAADHREKRVVQENASKWVNENGAKKSEPRRRKTVEKQ